MPRCPARCRSHLEPRGRPALFRVAEQLLRPRGRNPRWEQLRIEYESDSSGAGSNLFEYLDPLAPDRILEIGKAGDVLAGTCQTGGKAAADRVADEREYDRYGLRFLLNDPCHLIRAGHDDVGRRGDQLSCKSTSLVGIAAGPTIVDLDVAPFNPAQALQALQH